MPIRDTLIAVFVAFLWGAQVTAVKIGGEELPPILMVAMRFALIAVVLLPFCGVPKRSELSKVFYIASLTGALHFGLLYCGILHVDASTSAVAYQLTTPFTLLLGGVVFGERITLPVMVGIIIALLGVLMVVGGIGKGGELSGIVLVIAAAFVFAVGTLLAKRWGPFNPLTISAWTALIAAPELLMVSVAVERPVWGEVFTASPIAWAAVLYTAVSGGLIGFGLWYWLLGRHPIQRLAPFLLLVPVFAVAVSQLLLSEELSTNLIIGGVAVIVGVGLCQVRGLPKKVSVSGNPAG
ncbi:EamA family transporter [Pseudomonas tremae]|uniref:DMT family transporter n=1 Tax=Pseudomonas tremae TaxID=200454 RepID=UPI001F454086|nr:EamA family transporter [Pseudomonas tremae]MCF5715819.1 EamA family transporter [Pseudomonas tremae]MCQ2987942.1 EamA family transporter [Pseudomonas tremae]MCQ3024726.1 EamA family transporter [Pseudomonas tremae]UQB31887.1 EamA family transporter [Pseudomonas tremae]